MLRITDRLSLTGSRYAHNIELSAETNDVKGKWYDQKSFSQNGTTGYEVMNSSIKHKETYTLVRGSYRFDILDSAGVSSPPPEREPPIYRQTRTTTPNAISANTHASTSRPR